MSEHIVGSAAAAACGGRVVGPTAGALPPPTSAVAARRGRIAVESYDRRRTALKSWLSGQRYFVALEAMEFAEQFHTGLRRDGITPEFDHQIGIVNYLTTLHPHLRAPETTYAVGFTHDVTEDYDVPPEELEGHFGSEIADGTWAMTKTYRGVDRPKEEVLRGQAESAVASIGKGADRIHNHSTMTGVFTDAKIGAYIEETRRDIMPMLKRARAKHPFQDGAYQNARGVLRNQMELLEYALEGRS